MKMIVYKRTIYCTPWNLESRSVNVPHRGRRSSARAFWDAPRRRVRLLTRRSPVRRERSKTHSREETSLPRTQRIVARVHTHARPAQTDTE